MSTPVIPPSPTREDYARDYAAALAANSDESIWERPEPMELFIEWLEQARAHEVNDPNAMTLATVDARGAPDARMVLLKDVDSRGFTFYSNSESAKGQQLAVRPQAALVFHWKSLRRQVRVRGEIEEVTADEADAYFSTRAREARIGAWASDQSRPIADGAALERKIAEKARVFGEADIVRPPHWKGWRLTPNTVEFWRDRPFRIHDRLQFGKQQQGWRSLRLQP